MIPNPILKVLSTLTSHQVRHLLMGGQACVLYGAAEFSRDTDLAVLAEPENLERLSTALSELQATCIAVPPFRREYLLRGHAVHFRCANPDAARLRIDVMAVLRGVAPFDEIWQRRTVLEIEGGMRFEVMALSDLVQAKKTQRDKDWPMIRRLLEAHHASYRESPRPEQVRFWLEESRTIPMLIELARAYPELAGAAASRRPLLRLASKGDAAGLAQALEVEEALEREADRVYWLPLKAELEALRHSSRKESMATSKPEPANKDAGEPARSLNFIESIVEEDLKTNKWDGRVQTRFPPEPNGYLHIGHAKSICLNFGLAQQYGGKCNLRFDDTNPVKEEVEYINAIQADVRWLGFEWDALYYASDYFEQLYQWAEQLIEAGKAYVCDLSAEETARYRGGLDPRTAKESPYRNRPIEENLDLFRRMKAGEFPDGSRTLRAKIDWRAANLNLRDPVMYRILHAIHPHAGDKWCIYPMYDWAHGQSDSIEKITHSICTLEFENHRPLYDWFVEQLGIYHPRQIEFARLNLSYTLLSKRKLIELVQGGYVKGWDDPRMPTIAGIRRRGYSPEAIRRFCKDIGVAKFDGVIEVARLENAIREDLNRRAPRALAVLRPLRVVLDNYPEGQVEELDAVNNPEDPSAGTRKVPFARIFYIDRDDFREDPPKQFFRLAPGREVRLRYAYFVKCERAVKDPTTGEVVELHCTYDPATRGGNAPDGRKVKGTIHWVAADHAVRAEVRLYDHLFSKPDPDEVPEGGNYKDNLNPNSLEVLPECWVERSLAGATPGSRYQFERQGYFCVDPDSTGGRLVFNRTVTLVDTWAKIEKAQQQTKKK